VTSCRRNGRRACGRTVRSLGAMTLRYDRMQGGDLPGGYGRDPWLVRTHGMQMFHAGHHGCGLLVHEMAEMAPAGQTQPHCGACSSTDGTRTLTPCLPGRDQRPSSRSSSNRLTSW